MRVVVFIGVFLTGLIAATASDPVIIEYGAGNQMAIGASAKADKELHSGDLEGARRDCDAALRIAPNFWPALFTRAKLFCRQGKWELALQDCNAGLKQEPAMLEFAVMRAAANHALGRHAAALKELDHVINLHSPRANVVAYALSQRAWLRATCADASLRNTRQAVTDAKQACSLNRWNDASMIDTLAVACAMTGDFDSAVRYEEQAMRASDANEMGKTLSERLALFKQHRVTR